MRGKSRSPVEGCGAVRNFHNLGVEANVAFEVRQLWTALGLVAAGVGIALVPSSLRRLGLEDVAYLKRDQPENFHSDHHDPIMMSCRTNDGSPLLAYMIKLVDEFDQWAETDITAPRRTGATGVKAAC